MKSILFVICLFIFACCNSEPPEAEVIINDETELSTFRGSYHWTDGAAEYDLPPEIVRSEELEPTDIESGAVGDVVFDDGSAPDINVYEWSGNSAESELEVQNREVVFPEESGSYILEISAKWEGETAKSASYVFNVEVN